jgi:hypothetical protein
MKLDASYLGPDVGLAQRLADLGNREYKSAVLLSGPFVHVLGKQIRDMCRRIDMISVDSDAGGVIDLYTIDLDQPSIRVASFKPDAEFKTIKNPQLREYMVKQARIERKSRKLSMTDYDPIEQFEYTDLEILRKKFRSKNGLLFNQLFTKSLLNYLCGEWEVAKRSFRQCLIFWLTHTSESRRRHVDEDPSAPARRARALHVIQTSDDHTLTRTGFDIYHVDGPSASLFRYIVRQELVFGDNYSSQTILPGIQHREWRGYRSF